MSGAVYLRRDRIALARGVMLALMRQGNVDGPAVLLVRELPKGSIVKEGWCRAPGLDRLVGVAVSMVLS
jgi:hypothetical protein